MYATLMAIHLFLFAVSLVYIGIVLFEKASDTSKYLFVAVFSVSMVIIGYLLELMGTDQQFSLVSVKVQLLGLFYLNTFLCFFLAKCCNVYIPTSVRFIMLVVDTVFLFFAVTAEYHTFFFESIDFVTDGYYSRIVVTDGVVNRISQGYNMLLIAMNIFLCVNDFFRNKQRKSVETLCLIFMYSFSAVAGVLYYTIGVKRMGFNPVPASIVLGMGYMLFMVYRFRILDTRQVAKESIIETINEVYVVVDVGRNLLFANKKAYDVLPGLYNSKDRAGLIEKFYQHNRQYVEVGEKQYQVSVSPFYDRNTLKGYSLWLFDKTEELANTRHLIELKDKAEEANRAKTVFLANMSHEIRTPMNAIMGTTELILHSNPEPEIEEKVEDINRAGNVLLQIISGILDFSKIESGELESVEFNYDTVTYIRDTIGMVEKKITGKGLEFRIIISPTLPKGMRGDATHLRQIITNLLDNAGKYTQKGFVELNIDWEEAEDNTAKLMVSVSDSGCGIKEKAIPYLFDSFKRADLRRNIGIEGTGLGLAIARRLTEGMGGEISVQSVYGEGSTFSFYVYQTITDPAPIGDFSLTRDESRHIPAREEGIIAPGAKILCVDDNETNRKVIRDLLSLFEIQADTAESGEECLAILQNNRDYHLIFMDQMMPGMDGIETAKIILSTPEIRTIPIIALTANAVAGAEEMFIQNGFRGYLSKPVDIGSIKAVLLKFLPGDLIRKDEPSDAGMSNEEYLSRNRRIVLPEVDVDAALARYGYDTRKYLQVLYYVYEDGEKQIARMKIAAEGERYNEFACEVHAIKGVMQGIGANALSEMAKEAEKEAKAANPSVNKEEFEVLVSKYEMLLANIGFVLKDYNMLDDENADVAEKGEDLSKEEFKVRLGEIKTALDLLDAARAEELLRDLLSHPMEEEKSRVLQEALSYTKDFEYEKAIQMISIFQ